LKFLPSAQKASRLNKNFQQKISKREKTNPNKMVKKQSGYKHQWFPV